MKFVKRRFGNSTLRPIFGGLAIIVLILVIIKPNVLLFCFAPLFVLLGIVNLFGKEMVEIDPNKNTMDTFYNVIFEFSRSKSVLSNIDYILVRDFGTMQNHTILGSDSGFYEVSFVRTKGPRIVLAYRESGSGIRSLISEFETNCTYLIKDGTRSKVLGRK